MKKKRKNRGGRRMMKREGDEWKTEKKGFSDSKLVFFL